MDPKTNSSGEMDREQHHEKRDGTGPLAGSYGAFVHASPVGPKITLAPPDEGGSGAGAGGGAGSADAGAAAGGEDTNKAAENAGSGDGGDQKPARPEFIPENWWDADKGFKSDDFNALVARDAERQAAAAQVPESPDKYEAKLPQDFKLPDGIELAEGEAALNPDDPRVVAAREFAHTKGMNQADFEQLLAFGVNMDLSEQTRLKDAVFAEKEKLGPKGADRIGAVKTWVAAKLGGELAEPLLAMMYTAKQIEAFEALMRLNRGAVPGNPGAGRDAGRTELSDEEWSKMSPTARINYARENSKK
ncbi:MAG: hypothetical protein K0M49_20000 [Arenimonas sp.]|nr:hypothetical protein [Arenimonas sp.]